MLLISGKLTLWKAVSNRLWNLELIFKTLSHQVELPVTTENTYNFNWHSVFFLSSSVYLSVQLLSTSTNCLPVLLASHNDDNDNNV